jgi:hypothetical protein
LVPAKLARLAEVLKVSAAELMTRAALLALTFHRGLLAVRV